MPAIGIDLGTTHCCVGVWQNHAGTDEDERVEIIINDLGGRVTPSWVAFTDTERLVGAPAKAQAYRNAENTCDLLLSATAGHETSDASMRVALEVYNSKRLIGRKFSDDGVQADIAGMPFEVAAGPGDTPQINVKHGGIPIRLAPEQISAMLLTRLKAYADDFLNEETTQLQAVITVPAHFNDRQRAATKAAGEIAGLQVLRIMNEPMAAALAYELKSSRPHKSKVLIFDLGGGTCDVLILEVGQGTTQALAVKGDSHLGGEDLDQRIVEHLLEEIQEKHNIDLSSNARARRRLQDQAEKAKCTLSSSETATIDIDNLLGTEDFHAVITRARFQHLCADLFDHSICLVTSCLEDAGLEAEDIDEVVLVGGSTRIPKVQSLLRQVFPGKRLNKRINPDEAVAYGAAVQAAKLAERQPGERQPCKLQRLMVQDVTPVSLGIGLQDDTVSVLIAKNTRTPVVVTRRNFVVPAGCVGVTIPVYEGEERLARRNNLVGEFALVGLPKSRASSRQVVVTFEIDANGILAVKAMHRGSGKWRQIRVAHRHGGLTGDDWARMKQEAEQL